MSIAQYGILSIISSTDVYCFMFDISKEWLQHHYQNIFLFFGILLVGLLSFEGGLIYGKIAQSKPLIVSLPSIPVTSDTNTTKAIVEDPSANTNNQPELGATERCPFAGSKNSNKYHLSTCAVVKRIKPENKICFASKEEAEKRGYIPSCMQ